MANNNQTESPLPTPGNNDRSASNLLPKFFRTEANRKFLQATIDQLTQPGAAEKISGYIGRETAKAYSVNDNYIGDVSKRRSDYQFEPAVVIKDDLDNVVFYKDYNDYIGTLNIFGANTGNHSRLNSQEMYSWNPNIEWDKFVNFREYYWLPNGPVSVPVFGQGRSVASTYTVTLRETAGDVSYVFSPDGLTSNPSIKLYRGQTYRFEVDVPGHPMALAVSRSFTPGTAILTAGTEGLRAAGLFDSRLYDEAEYDVGDFIIAPDAGSVDFEGPEGQSTLYPDGVTKYNPEGEQITLVYVERGTIEFTVPDNAPDRLFYISKNDIDVSGVLRIYDIEENTFIDIEREILGAKYYTSENNVEFTNGLKVKFRGDVSPAKYQEGEWYVEGVGHRIELISARDLTIPAAYVGSELIPYDSDEFDTMPFADARLWARDKDYIVINRASPDRSPWSRYNRWFHKDVVTKSAEYNNIPFTLNEEARARRPIIEFESGLKLSNFGVRTKQNVDLVDTFTRDVFSTIEGQLGYNIDGVDLVNGMRILFTADPDILVNGKIYVVRFIEFNNRSQISLVEAEDATPNELDTVLVVQGNEFAGKMFYYENSEWHVAQDKTERNQAPLFDVFDSEGNSYGDASVYQSTTFTGSRIFSYATGTGRNDAELGFPLAYQTIENTGDILFNFNLLSDNFMYEDEDILVTKKINKGYLKKYNNQSEFRYVNGFSSTPRDSKQYVIRQYEATDIQDNDFEVDVFDNAASLTDLKLIVYVNNQLQFQNEDYIINRINNRVFVHFNNRLSPGDIVRFKAHSRSYKNNNGYYEIPYNLERNPLNSDITEFTLGEVIDHVSSMIEEIPNFRGNFPGTGNLRDLGDVDRYGTRFVKHSAPMNMPIYHLTSKKYNVNIAIDYTKDEYSRFKRNFLSTAETLGFDGPVAQHVDRVFKTLNKDKTNSEPFYLSDMVATGPFNQIDYTVLDSRTVLYALTDEFTLSEVTSKAVLVYLNAIQLSEGVDYDFSVSGFINVKREINVGDRITIREYDTTDGSYVPSTPTKLGLFPKFVPELTLDDTYQTSSADQNRPYKIYGQVADGYVNAKSRGWFYPVFATESAANSADLDAGGTGESTLYQFAGLQHNLYIPNSIAVIAGQDNVELDEYPEAIPFIRGHDGSYVRAYYDFRDNLLLELENRIFNNIKVQYDPNLLDVREFLGGEFRDNEFTREEVNDTLLGSFTKWLAIVDNDYTDSSFYNRNNSFTFNYGNTESVTGKTVPGFWRGIYQRTFDTDRPHSHPWEMLGFTIKPSWWNEVYGPAPYTSNNLILWRDLEEGRIREPNKPVVIVEKYARPGLLNFIPADARGRLRSPLESNTVRNFVARLSNQNFKFGDHAPVETAWRRSSDYPFAVLKAFLLNKPAKVMSLGFDVSRITRNLAGQISYDDTETPIVLRDLKMPNACSDSERVITVGLSTLIQNLIVRDRIAGCQDYKNDLQRINNQIGFKLGGYSDKQKLNLILDSRSPQQAQQSIGNFVPQESYQIFYNVSSPFELVNYSGVAVEKTEGGYIVRGYNVDQPYFEYYNVPEAGRGIFINVGGISENFSQWAPDRRFVSGQIIQHNNRFYRVSETFTSGQTFSSNNLAPLQSLPIIGGRTAEIKREFNKRSIVRLPYGTKLRTSQEVINFLVGYGERLSDLGFEFNYSDENGSVDNWDQIIREFLFWTTQGWASGTLITMSPGANRIEFRRDYAVVDDLFDQFYSYGIYRADGQLLDRDFSSLERDKNSFSLTTVDSDEGLYNISLPLVQKEHVVLLENRTIFNDVIYDLAAGYRQDRIKVAGYRSSDWDGSLNIPGFVFDNAEVTDWTQWKDYSIGSLVQYKQFFYVAKENVVGSAEFNSNQWHRLESKPQPELITNFDYRINQFGDFYDIDTEGFDADIQTMAQRLTGYQKRSYLANIINDDVSQHKFYQGFIQDKGTRNALTKLFDALGSAGRENLEFYEEWAIQVGRYGAVDDIQQVEFNIKQNDLRESPQPVQLVQNVTDDSLDNVIRILPHEVFDKPSDYDHRPFPVSSNLREYIRTSGYVHEDDVNFIAKSTSELTSGDANELGLGDYIWVTETNTTPWNVYQHVLARANVIQLIDDLEQADDGTQLITLVIDRWVRGLVEAGDVVGVRAAWDYNITGMYIVESASLDRIKIRVADDNNILPFANENFILTKLRPVRMENVDSLNELVQEEMYRPQRIWVDNFNNNSWTVLENTEAYQGLQNISNPESFDSTDHEFGNDIAVSYDNTICAVSASGNNRIYIYQRNTESADLILSQILRSDEQVFNELNPSYGETVDVSPDGEYIVVGVPDASNITTRYRGDWEATETYNKNEIVRYRESLWRANRQILPEVSSQEYTTFSTYEELTLGVAQDLPLLITGDLNIPNTEVDHILVRAPRDMYLGSKARTTTSQGDNITLKWNDVSYSNGTLADVEPFNGQIPGITTEWMSRPHEIRGKVDRVIYVDTFITLPQVGDIVTTITGSAEVLYVANDPDSVTLYLSSTEGVFDPSGELFVDDENFVGIYEQLLSENEAETVGGFWMIMTYPDEFDPTSFKYENTIQFDNGTGLIYQDLKPASDLSTPNLYFNIQDAVQEIGQFVTERNRVSWISHLSYFGDPAGEENTNQLSNIWVARLGANVPVTINQEVEFRVYDSVNRSVDFDAAGFNKEQINAKQTVQDLWDGYIDVELTPTQQGVVFTLEPGDVVENVQTPFNTQGGLSITSQSTGTAEVVEVQRQFNNVRVYVKNKTGTWNKINNLALARIRRIRINEPNRIVGVINDYDNDVVVGTSRVGKLAVFYADAEFPVVNSPELIEEEYYLYNEDVTPGVERSANPPFKLNRDYSQVYNIVYDEHGEPVTGYEQEGAVAVYRRRVNGTYVLVDILVSEYRGSNRRFGNKVRIAQFDNFYTLLIGSEGAAGELAPGAIEIYRHGVKSTDQFVGPHDSINSYDRGDIVVYRDSYYKALHSVPMDIDINNRSYWENISWYRGKDKNYRGQFSPDYDYAQNSVVAHNGRLYRAMTNVVASAGFNENVWEMLSTKIDYLGYLPNLTANTFYDEEVFDPLSGISQFSYCFDVSDDGEVLVVTSRQADPDSALGNKIVVYRLDGEKYLVDQVISPTTIGDISTPEMLQYLQNIDHSALAGALDSIGAGDSWAATMSMNPSGTHFAVGLPTKDSNKAIQGTVYVFTFSPTEGKFMFSQILSSPNNEEVEKFGSSMYFGDDNLVIASLNGDQKIPVTFDASLERETTFDNKFTTFNNIIIDTGAVYVYEHLNSKLVYAEQFRYDLASREFGNVVVAHSNHIYLGMPSQISDDSSSAGIVADFRKHPGTFAWKQKRSQVIPVDVNRINGAMLYNKRKNRVIAYVDYIDAVQGKIAGPAEQEITYKTGFDPAVYNVGPIADEDVDVDRHWGKEHVGEVWWNVSTARFVYPYQGSVEYQKDVWNTLAEGASIDIYEWVESPVPPTRWNELADTDDGIARGISGRAIYGDNKYSAKLVYDRLSQSFSTLYYFWVAGKTTIPMKDSRSISIDNIARLIRSPREEGYRFISLLSDNKFVLNNFENIITSDDVVINIKYNVGTNETRNVHSQYQIVTDGQSGTIDTRIERKWFDSLVGFDQNQNTVPDVSLPAKSKYGVQDRPRQGMFVNRVEALKQFVERVNRVLQASLIVDSYDISALDQIDPMPSQASGRYDVVLESTDDLRTISTNRIRQAQLTPIITNGRIVRVIITDSGRGYRNPPTINAVDSNGTGVEFETQIDNLGRITSVRVVSQGSGYSSSTSLVVRKFTALIESDDSAFGKWTLYAWDNTTSWFRQGVQSYDVTRFWNYIDWYADGVNQFTEINYNIDGLYQLDAIDDEVGDVVRISNIGTGGWVLLRKVADRNVADYTINYETIGRQNGTIQLGSNLYDYSVNSTGFDNRTYDSFLFDNNPAIELRIILDAIRDDIFVGELAVEYNQLFFASLRYILAEQQSVDWLFKTSFVRAKHNVGGLEQPVNFKNDSLASFQEYVNEVKPYSTKVREFVSAYESLDNTRSSVTDFDLPPTYDTVEQRIVPNNSIVTQGVIQHFRSDVNEYPKRHWLENTTHSVSEVKISDSGNGYTFAPTIRFISDSGQGARAKAYISDGRLIDVKILDTGSGYLTAPRVEIDGPQVVGSRPATASAILSKNVVRTPTIVIKFDRLSGQSRFETFEDLYVTETFTGTNDIVTFGLEWPMTIDQSKVQVFVDGEEQFKSRYNYSNIENTEAGYTRKQGQITFIAPPALDAEIEIRYYKDVEMLTAEERIGAVYSPLANMFGKDLSQLMTGIDYGGVEVQGLDFGRSAGWGEFEWYSDPWAPEETATRVEVFIADGSTTALELSQPLEDGEMYTVYLGDIGTPSTDDIRIDDENFDAGNPTNPNALINSIFGDGSTTVIDLQDIGLVLTEEKRITIHKASSDGSVEPSPEMYDTALQGGDLAYNSATGLKAEDIIVDGDGFVTPTTSSGPEELVPGQVNDTLDITVFQRASSGQGVVFNQTHVTETGRSEYDLGAIPSSADAVIVKVDKVILDDDDYDIDWQNNKLVLLVQPGPDKELNILTLSRGVLGLIDIGRFIADGETTDFETPVRHTDNLRMIVKVNGQERSHVVFMSPETQNAVIRLATIPEVGTRIDYTAYANDNIIEYSEVTKDSFVGDGSTTSFVLSRTPVYDVPIRHNILVKVGNKILQPGYSNHFVLSPENNRILPIERFQFPVGSITEEDVTVYKNGSQIFSPGDWRFDSVNNRVIVSEEASVFGDEMDVYVVTSSDYVADENVVTLTDAPADGEQVEIYQFTNHDIPTIRRTTYVVEDRAGLERFEDDYFKYQRMTAGEFDLDAPVPDIEYAWVVLNGTLLTPTVDYTLVDNNRKIQLAVLPNLGDTVDLFHFTAPVIQPEFAFKQFKDMLNRTHYKRVDPEATVLAKPLNYYDLRIEVVDSTRLDEPDKGKNVPGVVFINGERIEYFVKDGNLLRQLRRGTLGTGVKELHEAGSSVFDVGRSKTIPYADKTQVFEDVVDGSTTVIEPSFVVNNKNEIEVFVAGRRLNKGEISVFNPDNALDSPLGDEIKPAEFSVEDGKIHLHLSGNDLDGCRITVVKKTLMLWSALGESLSYSDSPIAQFLRSGASEQTE